MVVQVTMRMTTMKVLMHGGIDIIDDDDDDDDDGDDGGDDGNDDGGDDGNDM